MTKRKKVIMFIGIDGCKPGWCTAVIEKDYALNFFTHKGLSEALQKYADAELILMDMPLGLKESGQQERKCDKAARKLLNKRFKSSIFRVPVRQAIFEDEYAKASLINHALTGKKLSKQIFYILPKIKELYGYILNHGLNNIREASPELCFKMLAGHDLEYSKKRQSGFLERVEIIKAFDKDIECKTEKFKAFNRGLEKDDILDSAILAVSAKLGFQRDSIISIPDLAEYDRHGIKMQISYVKNN